MARTKASVCAAKRAAAMPRLRTRRSLVLATPPPRLHYAVYDSAHAMGHTYRRYVRGSAASAEAVRQRLAAIRASPRDGSERRLSVARFRSERSAVCYARDGDGRRASVARRGSGTDDDDDDTTSSSSASSGGEDEDSGQ